MRSGLSRREKLVALVLLVVAISAYWSAPDHALTVCTLFVNMTIGYATFLSARGTADSAKAAQASADSALAGQRPRLIVNVMSFAYDPHSTLTPQAYVINFSMANLGCTVAELTQVSCAYQVVDKLPDLPSYRPPLMQMSFGRVLSPSGEDAFSIDMILTEKNVHDILNQDARLWVYGYVAYKDYLDEHWVKGFCGVFKPYAGGWPNAIEARFLEPIRGSQASTYEYTRRGFVDGRGYFVPQNS